MNTYIELARQVAEDKIVAAIREFETDNKVTVMAVNFTKVAMCDKDEQKIQTWGIELPYKED